MRPHADPTLSEQSRPGFDRTYQFCISPENAAKLLGVTLTLFFQATL